MNQKQITIVIIMVVMLVALFLVPDKTYRRANLNDQYHLYGQKIVDSDFTKLKIAGYFLVASLGGLWVYQSRDKKKES